MTGTGTGSCSPISGDPIPWGRAGFMHSTGWESSCCSDLWDECQLPEHIPSPTQHPPLGMQQGLSAQLSSIFLVSSQNPEPWQYEFLQMSSAVSGWEIKMGNAPSHGDGATWVKYSGISHCFSAPSAGSPVLDLLLSQLLWHFQYPRLTRAGHPRVEKEPSEPCWEKQEPGQSWEGFPTAWAWDQVSSTMAALGSQASQGQPGLCH